MFNTWSYTYQATVYKLDNTKGKTQRNVFFVLFLMAYTPESLPETYDTLLVM